MGRRVYVLAASHGLTPTLENDTYNRRDHCSRKVRDKIDAVAFAMPAPISARLRALLRD
jgi:hypothetical protein